LLDLAAQCLPPTLASHNALNAHHLGSGAVWFIRPSRAQHRRSPEMLARILNVLNKKFCFQESQ
jgi:hypothetical protein